MYIFLSFQILCQCEDEESRESHYRLAKSHIAPPPIDFAVFIQQDIMHPTDALKKDEDLLVSVQLDDQNNTTTKMDVLIS